jgi:hypothetical protein
VCPESSEDGPEVTLMVFVVLGVDKDVVNEDYDKLIQLFHKYLIHEVHEKADQRSRRSEGVDTCF